MNNKKLLFFLLLCSYAVSAQIVTNKGLMTVNSDTKLSFRSDFDNQPDGTLWNDGELFVFANLNNDGLVTFTPELTGFTRFEGEAKQRITGTEIYEFQNILFNNRTPNAAFELHGHISVAKLADFTDGILNNNDFGGMMIFEKAGTFVNVGDNSFVDGTVKKIGGESFVFPIGNSGNYRNCEISASGSALSSFTANYHLENSNTQYPHNSKTKGIQTINDREFWIVEKTAGNADIMLTLSWDEGTTTPPTIVASPEEDIHIIRWDAAKKTWVDEGGVADISNRTVTTATNVSGYGVFTLGRVATFSPLQKLRIYNAVSPNGDGLNDYFRIEGLNELVNVSTSVQIFNRWGAIVYKTNDYAKNGNVFEGYANTGGTSGNTLLPSGTYFYILDINSEASEDKSAESLKKSGYLYLN